MPAAKASAACFDPRSFDVRVDAYIAKAAPFAQPICEHLRQLLHDTLPGIVEEIKWSMPFFVYKGVILAHLAAFKQHCSFELWGERGEAAQDGMGSFGRLTGLADLPTRAELRKCILSAAKKIESGERTKAWTRRPKQPTPEAEVPQALADALVVDKAAGNQFEAMSASCRREYCEWIAEAKKDDTRAKRVAQAVEWIAQGKGRNWKYQR